MLFALTFLLCLIPSAHGQQISLSIDDIGSPSFQIRGVAASLENDRFAVSIEELTLQGQTWKNIHLSCPKIRIEHDTIACDQGVLQGKQNWPVRFSFSPNSKKLSLDLRPAEKERWHIDVHWGKHWKIVADIENGDIAYATPWLPANIPTPNAGNVSGKLRLNGSSAKLLSADAELQLASLAFSDASGLHAGEKISVKMTLRARQERKDMAWQSHVSWDQGEIYWHPLYVSGSGVQLVASGHSSPQLIELERGVLNWPTIGEINASAVWDIASRQFAAATFEGKELNLGPLHATFLLPFLEKTALAKTTAAGKVGFSGRIASGEVQELDLNLSKVSLQDKEGRFALNNVHFTLPWRARSASMADLDIGGGRVLALPIGSFKSTIHLQDKNISIPRLAIPILGGSLNIENFRASQAATGWRWEFEGGLTPISMEQLSSALHLPKMHGTLAGVVPRVHYESGKLALDGALLVKAFDGTAVLQDLVLLDVLGHAPRMQASLDMRNLDLDLLTRAFSFGNMQGRIDVTVKGLELSNWKPVTFDAAVRSSPGNYPRKISQRAVQNISALGGAGAAAAIQRSFLGFFEEFGYSRIGLSCVLRNSVCMMDGVEPAPNGYVIVKGGGIPAITVIGYNRSVSWDELIARLQRVTQGNAKPIVQ
ncbi:MAG: hypothetical protein KKH74_13145 [Gammaproteobacteria bacterium]|nr:hypothetical protein [Gammaproteobacteria bacterium]MBU1732729.1 hypothetical protein [Gammaproteobacteria bacterium]MBU1891554.1 hypothetical protein [Gammaproteobacteria bacterium]